MRLLWTAAGIVFVGLGVAGIILPMMPGTIFLFLASLCFLRGSQRLHDWLVNHRVLGPHVRMVTGKEPMPLRAKVFAISAMWIAVLISLNTTAILAVQITLVVLAAIGTWVVGFRMPRPGS